jgi:hypothetical protein
MTHNLPAVLPKTEPETAIREILATLPASEAVRILGLIFYDLLSMAYKGNLVKLSIAPVFIDRDPSNDNPAPKLTEEQVLQYKPPREPSLKPRSEDHSRVRPPLPGGCHPTVEDLYR